MTGRGDGKARESWSYSGEVWTDEEGHAVVVLPPFVHAHRHGFEYELTPATQDCSVVSEGIDGDRFTIVADKAHVKVAWRVTALKDDSS